LLILNFDKKGFSPYFNEQAKLNECPDKEGYVVYYTNRCPYTEYHATVSLAETVAKRKLNVKVIKLETIEQAQFSPISATIFPLFYNGKFITANLSLCMDNRFDKIISKIK
jgi:hypothetical protein